MTVNLRTKLLTALLATTALLTPASADSPGKLAPYTLYGNPTGTAAAPKATPMNPLLPGGAFYARSYGSCIWDASHDVGPCILLAYEAAAAAGGGTVIMPSGEFGLATTLTEGNGTTSAISTKNAVTVKGVPQPFIRVGVASTLGRTSTRLKWIGAANAKMARTVGPAVGLVFDGIAFDANDSANTCLEAVSSSRARHDRISCSGYIGTGIILTTQPSITGVGDDSQFSTQGVEFGLLQLQTLTAGTTALSLDGYPDNGSGGTGFDTVRVKFDGLLIGVPCSGSSIGIRVAFADQNNFHNTALYSIGSCDGTSKALQFVPTTTAASGHFPQNINFTGVTDFGQNLGFDFGASSAGSWTLMGVGHSADNLTSSDLQVVPRDPATRYLKFSMTGTDNLPLGGRRYEGGQMIAERQFRNILTNSTFNRSSAASWSSPASGTTLVDDWIVQYDGSMAAQTFDLVALTADTTGYQHPFEARYFLRVPLNNQSGGTFYNIAQRIPHNRGGARLFAGHKATLSFWVTGDGCGAATGAKVTQNFGTGGSPSSPVVGFATGNAVPELGAWKRVFNQFAIGSVNGKTFGTNDDDYLEIAINLPSPSITCNLQISSPQFEEGIVDTAFEVRPQPMDDLLAGRWNNTFSYSDTTGSTLEVQSPDRTKNLALFTPNSGAASLGNGQNEDFDLYRQNVTQLTLKSFGSQLNGHVAVSAATAPALTSCGTDPTIVGDDQAGEVTMGTGAPTGCVITFFVAYAAAPLCVVTWQATPLASQSYALAAATITLTQTAASSNKVNYACRARTAG